MTAQPELPGQVSTLDCASAPEPQVVRRATQLCLRAEPHTDEVPCPAHVSEANRQLFRIAF
jgi:hypothetical protein